MIIEEPDTASVINNTWALPIVNEREYVGTTEVLEEVILTSTLPVPPVIVNGITKD